MVARARSPGATSACRSPGWRVVREEAAAYPVITGPRTLFEVETPRARLSLTYHHRPGAGPSPASTSGPPRGLTARIARAGAGSRLPLGSATRRSRGGCAGTAPAPSPTRSGRTPTNRAAVAPSAIARRAAYLQSARAALRIRSLPRPDARRVRRAPRIGGARARGRQRVRGRGQPRGRPRRDGRVAVDRPPEVRGSTPTCSPGRHDRGQRAGRPLPDARRRRRRGLRGVRGGA